MRNTLTPQACSATNSRSAERRPRPSRMPYSRAIGIVTQSACGTSVINTRAMIGQDTPLAISFSAFCRIGGIISTKVRPSSASSSGGTISRTRYRSRIFNTTRLQRMTRVAILWHMHQPYYEDLATREHILPWVRLHALKDYYGMVALLREFPDVRVTFNLVPSLLVQLEAFAEGRARDRFLELSLKPAADLDERDVAFVLENFFHAQRQHMIDVHPRYGELLARRSAAARFTVDDLRDLQVWAKLAWVDPFYLDGDSRIRGLVAKGRAFSEDDKSVLREVEFEILGKVIPEYRAAAERGQIELSASPFYHPILPLLCDTDVYLRTHPNAPRPRQPFRRPEDAEDQLERAADCHARLFGKRPIGPWPSDGSVSDAMVPLIGRAGFRWMATDEMILARTLGISFTRDSRGQV